MEQFSEHQMDCRIAQMLKLGISLAALLVCVGGLLFVLQGQQQIPDYRHFHEAAPSMRSLKLIGVGAMHLQALSVIQFGLVVLIATPVVRVVYCLYGFAKLRNSLYVAISGIVLAVLLYSLSKGAH